MTLRGRIVEAAPIVYGRVRDGRLYLGSRGDVPFVVDTGFTGTLAVPPSVTRRIDCRFVAIERYALAAGQDVELPMYIGSIQIGARRLETWFIVGDALIGMELLQRICSCVHLDLARQRVELALKVGR